MQSLDISMTPARTTINGHVLPSGLLNMIRDGRWRCPEDQSKIDALFPEREEFYPYSFETMERETKGLCGQSEVMWLGLADATNPPGDIDPQQAVLIADLGIGYDQAIALDYRVTTEDPRVLTLHWRRDSNRWIEIAHNFEEFAKLIGLQEE